MYTALILFSHRCHYQPSFVFQEVRRASCCHLSSAMPARPSAKRELSPTSCPAGPSRAPVPLHSRQWSCSELRAGSHALKKVKLEDEGSLARLQLHYEADTGSRHILYVHACRCFHTSSHVLVSVQLKVLIFMLRECMWHMPDSKICICLCI